MRMSLHKEEILDMGVTQNQHGDRLLISYSLDGLMKIVSFQNQQCRPEVLKSISTRQITVGMTFHRQYMLLTLQNALQIFKVEDTGCRVTTSLTNALHDHETNILFVDIERTHEYVTHHIIRLIATCSLYTLKVFNFDKVCVLTIQLHLKIDLACFVNQKADVLLSIDGGLAQIRNILKYMEFVFVCGI